MKKRIIFIITLSIFVFFGCTPSYHESAYNIDTMSENRNNKYEPIEVAALLENNPNFRVVETDEQFVLRYEILDNSREIVKSFATSRPAQLGLISENVVELWVSAGTNVGWAVFFSIKDDILSDYFPFPYVVKGELIAYIPMTNYDTAKLVVQNIFESEIYFREFLLEGFAPVGDPINLIIDMKFLDNDRIEVVYWAGEDFLEKSIILQL